MTKTWKPAVSLAFSGFGAEQQPERVEIVEHEFRHDLAVLTVPDRSVDSKRYRSAVPVSLSWSTSPTERRSFVGYVSHVEPVATSADKPERKRVICIGASFVLKEGGYDGFKTLTASAMVKQVATKFRFDTAHIEAHSRIFPSLSQNGRSYWQFLIDLAERVGYTLYCRGTNLYFHDRLTALSKQKGLAVFGGGGLPILAFESKIGKTTPAGGTLANRAAYGVSPTTGKAILAQRKASNVRPLLGRTALEALFTVGDPTRAVADVSEGNANLDAEARAHQLTVTATARLRGNTRVRVGDAIYLDGLGAVNSGRWFVTAATHIIEAPQSYELKVELGRDAIVATSAAPLSSVPTGVQRASRLTNGLWVAA